MNRVADQLLETLERRKVALLTDGERHEVDAVIRIVARMLPDILAAEHEKLRPG